MNIRGKVIDNYDKHDNGRIWICWDEGRRDIEYVNSTDQLIHCKVKDYNGEFLFWMTAVYAQNQIQRRKTLWHDLEKIHSRQQGPWLVIGDFNNVVKVEDRVGAMWLQRLNILIWWR